MISLRTAAVASAALATMAAVSAAPAQAQPTDPLPSALLLSVSQGRVPAQRGVLLICSPVVAGNHPQAAAACGELEAAGGNPDALRGRGLRFCPMIYDPVTLSAEGIWHGARVSYRRTYPNACQAANRSTYVFAF